MLAPAGRANSAQPKRRWLVIPGTGRPARFQSHAKRLMRLPAWERAKVYELAGIGLGEWDMIEAEVRARIAAEFRRAA